MITTYKLNVNELTAQLLEQIRKAFPGKEIEITVLEQDATEYLKSNPANERHINEAVERIEKKEGLISVDPASLKKNEGN
ncbi:MAG TPA: hypothetical protein VI757_16245 [Bacteroidia bacterium]|nr:hypothetical protein [Bacteroidia bacterium]